MKNSIYTTTAGMLTSAERLNVIANNLANFNTTGFKGDLSFEQTLKFLEEGPYPGKDQPVLGGTVVNMHPGVIQHTGGALDFAIQGQGFFTIQGPDNKQYYTRNGAFMLNSNKELVNSEGYNVLDKYDKKITVFGNKMQITSAGEVIIDDNYYTTLKVVDLPNRLEVEKVGNLFFKMKDETKTPAVLNNPDIVSGSLERSNVNLLEGISDTVVAQRTFDAQRAATDLIFRNIRRSITDIPRPV